MGYSRSRSNRRSKRRSCRLWISDVGSPRRSSSPSSAGAGQSTRRHTLATTGTKTQGNVLLHRLRGPRHLHRLPRRAPGASLPPRVSAAARCNWPLIFSGFEGFGSATRRSGRLDVGDEASRDALDRRIRVRGWFDPRRRFAGAPGDDPRSRASSRPRSARGAPLVTSIARRARVPRADSPHPHLHPLPSRRPPPRLRSSPASAAAPRA